VVALSGTLPWPYDETVFRSQQDDDGLALPRGDQHRLESGDRVFVRQLPGYVEAASVQIVGEVMNPGPYPVRLRDERLSSFLRRSGGITGDAYIEGARLVRDSILVGIDLSRAMEDPLGPNDLILEDGDRLEVPRFDPMVTVLGAVAFESRVPYREGWRLSDYLAQAGGSLHEADRDRVSVEYPNGQRAISRKALWVRRDPAVRPGSIIRVAYATDDGGLDWGEFLTRSLTITTTLVTLLLAAKQL
jgi:protein involved in polysaccharide export with SLBB domain